MNDTSSDIGMVAWLGDQCQRGSVPFMDYDKARTALVNGRFEVVREIYDRYAPQSERLQVEVDRLKAENAAMREIVQAVAQTDPTYGSEWRQCHYCHEIDLPDAFQHADDCPVTKARALLASDTD